MLVKKCGASQFCNAGLRRWIAALEHDSPNKRSHLLTWSEPLLTYISVYIYTLYICACLYIHTHIYIYICISIHIYIYVSLYIYIYTYIYIHVYTYIHILYICIWSYKYGYLYMFNIHPKVNNETPKVPWWCPLHCRVAGDDIGCTASLHFWQHQEAETSGW